MTCFLMKAKGFFALAAMVSFILLGTAANARVCTDISPTWGSDLNCASAGACTDKTVGDPCGGGNVCTAFAVRVHAACCSCSAKDAAAVAGLKCLDAKGKAEAKFVLCHAKETGRASIKSITADYGKCIQKLNDRYQKFEGRFGDDCPATNTAGEVANTLAALFGDQGIDEQSVMVCAPDAQWRANQQLCVPIAQCR